MDYEMVKNLLVLLGGMGMLVLGMRFLSDGLQTMAGSALKKLIGKVTENRVLGVLVGIGVTCIVQSSAVTMSMVIGFVNAEMMLLEQSLSVVMGANIGITVTGWLLALPVDQFGLPLAGICAIVYCLSKRERVKYTALACLGLGLVFFGLFAMKGALAPFYIDNADVRIFGHFCVDGFANLFLAIVAGIVLAAVLRSSVTSLALTIALAYEGLIDFNASAALVLGENIGSTIPPMMIAMKASRHARRAAFFHLCFNVFGVIWVTVLFAHCTGAVRGIFSAFGVADLDAVQNGCVPYSSLAIALFNTLFNVVNAVILFVFVGRISAVLEKMFKRKAKLDKVIATKLDFPLIRSPFAAITQSNREMIKMGETLQEMMADLRRCELKDDDSHRFRDRVFEDEEHLDKVQSEVISFLTELLSTRVSQSIAADAERELRMSDDLETASDYIAQILKLELRMEDNNEVFDESHQNGIAELHDMASHLVNGIVQLMQKPDDAELLKDIRRQGTAITQKVRELRSNHWNHVAEGNDTPLVSTSYTDMLNAYRKIKEHLVATAEALTAPVV